MQIFLSYSSVDREPADQINLAMLGSGLSVFFDKESLPPAGDYQTRIRKAVAESDFFVFLISPESVKKGSFALTELGYARKKWKHPRGKVLPVMLRTVAYANIPTYLKAVTVLEPEGNVAAEVTSAILTDASMTDGPAPPLQESLVERTIRVPDQRPVRPPSGSRVVAAAVSAVVLIGGAEWYLEVEKLVKSNKTWSWDWLFAPGVIWKLTIAALTMLAMAAWISVSIASNWRPGGGTAVERLKLAFVSTTVWLVYGGPLIIFVVPLVAQYCAPEEPLPFFSGIGI